MPSPRFLYTALCTSLLAAGAATFPAARAATPPSLQTLQAKLPPDLQPQAAEFLRLLTEVMQQRPSSESRSEPDAQRTDSGLLPVALPETIALINQAIARAPTAMLGALQNARAGFVLAEQRLQAGTRDASPQYLVQVLQAVAQGQTGLGQALTLAAAADPQGILMAQLLPAVQKVRDAAARTSQGLIDVAQRGGVAPARLAPALAAMQRGDALHQAGSHGAAVALYGQALGLAANTVVFSMNQFEQNLKSVFDTQTVGWAYALSQGGLLARSGAGGLARTAADNPSKVQSAQKKMHLASISKMLTATVVLRIMADQGVTPDSAIGPFLPISWDRGAGVDSITFRQLMTHRSGFGQNSPGSNQYASLQAMVAQAVPNKGSFDYDNANFGLLRVIVSVMSGVDPFLAGDDPAALTATTFLFRAKSRYDPIGVPFSCDPSASNPTLEYDYPDSGNPGYEDEPKSLGCGGYGVFMSAEHLARTMAYLRYTQDLIDAPTLQQMKAGHLGLMNPADNFNYAQGVFGNYYGHGGDWDHTNSGGLDTCAFMFPINVEAAVVINSSRKASGTSYTHGPHQCAVLKWAFENAWIAS